MTIELSSRDRRWWVRLSAPGTRVWNMLTEAPASVTDTRKRQQIRMSSMLCLAALVGGMFGFTLVHFGRAHNIDLTTNPVFPVFVVAVGLGGVAYGMSRNVKTQPIAPVVLIIAILGGNAFSMAMDPDSFYSNIIYIVMADVIASLLLPPFGTRLTLVVSLGLLLVYPLISDEITYDMALRGLGPLFVVAVMITMGVTMRASDLRTIEKQAHKLAEAKQQAESANQLKGVFLGMVSHELRTPLNNILGYSDQVLMGLTGDASGETLAAVGRIHRNGETLGRMINDLLMLSRLESGGLTINRRPFRPADLISEINHTFRDHAEVKGLDFITSIDAELPQILVGDPQRIEQIVGNLIANAVKFTDQGSITVRLFKHGPEEWSAEVSDTGIGVSAEAARRIFDRFFQVDSSSRRSHGGAGLGLAIARELAILMGGNISLKTAVNAGSTFTVNLPLTTDETDLHAVQTGSIVTAA